MMMGVRKFPFLLYLNCKFAKFKTTSPSSEEMNGIPPPSPTASSGLNFRSAGANDVFRSKNKKRDDAIRKKVVVDSLFYTCMLFLFDNFLCYKDEKY